MSQEKGTQRVTRYSQNKAVNNDTSSSQGVPTSVRPTEVRPDSKVYVLDKTQTNVDSMGVTGSEKFTRDVGQGLYDSVEYIVPKENLGQLEYERWQRGDPAHGGLSERGIVSGTVDTALGDHTWDEWYANVEKRVTEEPGRVVGEAIGDTLTAFGFTKATKYVHKGSQIAEKALKAKYVTNKSKLAETAMTSATGPTRAETIHATKMAKFNKSVGDVNKLNKEIDVAKSKVEMTPEQLAARDKMRYWLAREEADSGISVKDMAKQGGVKVENTAPSRSGGFVEKYTKASNPAEPRSHVDLYYQKLNEGGPLELSNKGGGFKDPATAVFGHGAAGINKDKYPKSFLGVGFKDPKTGLPLDGKTIPIQNQAILPSKTIDMISTKSIRGSGKENKMFRAAVFKINRKEKDEARIAIENLRKSDDAWLAKAEIGLLKKWKAGAPPRESFMMNTNKEFFPRDRFLTGAGIGALGVGGLGIFGLGAKNDKSN